MNDSTARNAVADSLLEDAIRAASAYARSLGNEPAASAAWGACLRLKALRRLEVVRRLDAHRLAGVRA